MNNPSNLPPGMTQTPGDEIQRPAIVPADQGGSDGLDFVLVAQAAWLTVGPLSLCIQVGEQEEQERDKHLRVEVFPVGCEDGDPLSRLEVSFSNASLVHALVKLQQEAL